MTDTKLEDAFAVTEEAAETALRSAASVVRQARALVKAAKTGNIRAIKRGQENLQHVVSKLQKEADDVRSCWPLSEEEEKRIFREEYAGILRDVAERKGVTLSEQDGLLLSYPSIVRILAGDLSVRIDRKKVSTVRPSFLADLLLQNQRKFQGHRAAGSYSPRFLESLYGVYHEILRGTGTSGQLPMSESGYVVPLIRIYKLMTALPGAAREYGRSDFTRDLYNVDSRGPRQTRKGATVSFPSSTGTRRRSSDIFSFIDPDGHSVEYYGIRFSEGQP